MFLALTNPRLEVLADIAAIRRRSAATIGDQRRTFA